MSQAKSPTSPLPSQAHHPSTLRPSHSSSRDKHTSSSSRRASRRDSNLTVDIPKGRPVSTSEIKSPKPINPIATQYILQTDYSAPTVEELTSRFSAATIEEEQYSYYDDMSASPPSSVGSSLSSRSDSSSPSSASSLSDYSTGSDCRCERYGITRGGDRVKLDCGGSRCGYSDDSRLLLIRGRVRTTQFPPSRYRSETMIRIFFLEEGKRKGRSEKQMPSIRYGHLPVCNQPTRAFSLLVTLSA
jgi:hypothetical protein